MRKLLPFIAFILLSTFSFAQKSKRLSKVESANLTQEQRNVRDGNRKSKGGKKDISMKKRVKIDQKQDKRARSIRGPKQKSGRKRPK